MWRRLLPRGLFARALIIVVAPVVILQLVLGALFYDRHLDTVVRRLVRGVVGDIPWRSSRRRRSTGSRRSAACWSGCCIRRSPSASTAPSPR
jgi:two-component system osmolarity sensor histidine kinase EnvZ